MRRPFLVPFLLMLAIGGFAAGFHHLHGGCDRREAFEQHVADICAQAALRATAAPAGARAPGAVTATSPVTPPN